MKLDDELRDALRREEPSAGFANRVLARTERRAAGSWFGAWRWSLAGALSILLALAGFEFRREQQRAAGERAKQELLTALRITGSKLQLVQRKVQRINQQVNRSRL
jgi:hypothetical protein